MMIKKISIFIFVFVLTCFSIQIVVYSISMAAFTENNYMTVKGGETAEFFIFFWNPEYEPFPVRLKATEVPEGMVVIIIPDDFILNSSLVTKFPAESGRRYINTEQGLMMTTSVKVLVKVSRTMELGGHEIVVKATVGTPSEAVSTLLEKNFRFNFNVTSLTFFENLAQTGKEISSGITDALKGVTGMVTAATSNLVVVFSIIIIIGIFVVFWIIYKR